MSENKSAKMVIVDEGVSDGNLMRFKRFAEEKGLEIFYYQFIRQLYPGMPDGQILYHLLNATTIFITSDRPLHNTVLTKGLESYYLDEETITGKPLRGIQLKADVGTNKKSQSLQESYLPPKTEIRSLLLSDSPQRLKKLRTKRRRIRNHFDGLDHLEQVAVTVSWQRLGPRILIGVRIQVSSNIGLKALEASESYTAETIPSGYCSIGSLSYALMLVIQLLLNSVKTVVYYDSARIDKSALPVTGLDGLLYQNFFERLSESFEHLEFVPVAKGRHMEALRKKLVQLVNSRNTNEIQQDNLQEILRKFAV
jgi:hypothetical protein